MSHEKSKLNLVWKKQGNKGLGIRKEAYQSPHTVLPIHREGRSGAERREMGHKHKQRYLSSSLKSPEMYLEQQSGGSLETSHSKASICQLNALFILVWAGLFF